MSRGGQNRVDLTARRFGRLVVMSHAHTVKKRAYWLCKCDCGKEKVIVGSTLKSGNSTSCGCLRSELVSQKNFKHGLRVRGSRNRAYQVWNAMMARCYSKTNADYHLYGDRGIRVCPEWHQAAVFVNWYQTNKPKGTGFSLDRFPDVNGPYSPSNCRFATASEQSKNRRPRNEWSDRCAQE